LNARPTLLRLSLPFAALLWVATAVAVELSWVTAASAQVTTGSAPVTTGSTTASAPGAEDAAPTAPVGVHAMDRVVVRFVAPETGGVLSPRFILERELSFEARLEALADDAFVPSVDLPYLDEHVRAAMERHIAETILETLEVTPQPTQQDIQRRVNGAQAALAQRVGSIESLEAAARAEGLAQSEVFRILQRQARASLYLDRMVAPMLRPSEAELRALHQSGRTPFTRQRFDEISVPLRRWYVSRRLSAALLEYYEGARSRLSVAVMD
jgi:hypothetical protein